MSNAQQVAQNNLMWWYVVRQRFQLNATLGRYKKHNKNLTIKCMQMVQCRESKFWGPQLRIWVAEPWF